MCTMDAMHLHFEQIGKIYNESSTVDDNSKISTKASTGTPQYTILGANCDDECGGKHKVGGPISGCTDS